MKKYILIAAGLFFSMPSSAQTVVCKHNGLDYSVGATICECPSMSGDGRTASGGRTSISSRRLVCAAPGEWKNSDSMCINVVSVANIARDDFLLYHNTYCPRPTFAEDADRFMERATPSQALVVLSALCRRFPVARDACVKLIEAVSAK